MTTTSIAHLRKLKRSECAVLPLVLKRTWYDMIASCVKKEEYRDYKPFWKRRIENWQDKWNDSFISGDRRLTDVVAFSNGYKKPDMFFVCTGLLIRDRSARPEWGEPNAKHYAILLGERVELVS